MSDFYLEFEVHDIGRFEQLRAAFEAIRQAKNLDGVPESEDLYWFQFFDAEAQQHFWHPTPSELAEWERRWFATPVPRRFTDPSLKTPWHFASMIDAFFNGEYELTTCEMVDDFVARLSFNPYAGPYGGSGCMQALIEAFGFAVTKINDETSG